MILVSIEDFIVVHLQFMSHITSWRLICCVYPFLSSHSPVVQCMSVALFTNRKVIGGKHGMFMPSFYLVDFGIVDG